MRKGWFQERPTLQTRAPPEPKCPSRHTFNGYALFLISRLLRRGLSPGWSGGCLALMPNTRAQRVHEVDDVDGGRLLCSCKRNTLLAPFVPSTCFAP